VTQDVVMRIREATADDAEFLAEMLLAAYNWSEDRFDLDWLRTEDRARRYLDGWPAPGDLGVVAVDGETRLGAAWARMLPADRPGYGFVAADVPELSIGVAATSRGRGVGRALMTALIDAARAAGHRRVSLSVEPDNYAARLYASLGFVVTGRDEGGSDTMVLDLRTASPPTGATPAGSAS
jgi:ribosomal protein S18 acetylase RimI-like enzyme